MPRKKTLKRKIRNKISDLEHAQEHHSSKKSIFGGLRLVLPGLTGNTTTSSLPARSKTTALHTTQWTNGESGLERPLNVTETERTSSSWARWSSIEPNVLENCKNQTSPQKLVKQSRKAILQPRSASIHDENTSRYIMAVNQGRRFVKIDPPAEPSNLRRPGKAITMMSTTGKEHKSGLVFSAAVGAQPVRDVDDSEYNWAIENTPEPKITEYEYYQQRSAHGGRLGIEERIDVFEPQIESQQQYIDDLESLPLRILAEDDTTTRTSAFATSSSKSAYTPSIVTQSSINESLRSSTQMGDNCLPKAESFKDQTGFMKASLIDIEPRPIHQQTHLFPFNETSTISGPDNSELRSEIDNLVVQKALSSPSGRISPVRMTVSQTRTPIVPVRNHFESDDFKKAETNEIIFPVSTPSILPSEINSINEDPSARELSETEEIDRLLAILDHIKKVEMIGDIQNESVNIPPRHNSPRKVFPTSQSPTRIKDFGSEPSMSSDGTFTERLKREAFAAFDDDDDNMIENPYLSPSGVESYYSRSLSESPQHIVIERQHGYSVKIANTNNQRLPEKVVGFKHNIQRDSMEDLPFANKGGSAPVSTGCSKLTERNMRKPFPSSETIDEQTTAFLGQKEMKSGLFSNRNLQKPAYAAMCSEQPFYGEGRTLKPTSTIFYKEPAGASQLPKFSQRDTIISANDMRSAFPVVQHEDKMPVASTFDANNSPVQNPFRSSENDERLRLQRSARALRDSQRTLSPFVVQKPSPPFIENDRTHLPLPSTEGKSFGKQSISFSFPVVQVTSDASKLTSKTHDAEHIPKSVGQSTVVNNDLYDDSANRIVRSEVRSPMLSTLSKSYSKETKSPLDEIGLYSTILHGSSSDAKNISQLPISPAVQIISSSTIKSRTKTPSFLTEKQGYASSPIRNYWREYSNVRVGGSFDSMSLKHDRSEETTICGTATQHSSFVSSTSEDNCSNVDRYDDRNEKKRNPANISESALQCSRSFQSARDYQYPNSRNVGPHQPYPDGTMRKVRSFHQQSPLKNHEFSRTEKYASSTSGEKGDPMRENINSPETEFMNFSTASQRATKEFNSRVQRAISPEKFVRESRDILTVQDGNTDDVIDDTKITPILRYKQYANEAANQAVSRGSNLISTAKDASSAFVKVELQSRGSHDLIARTKLPSREQNSIGSRFVRNADITDMRQSSILQNDCPSFDSNNAIADDLVEVLSVASSEDVLVTETQKVRSNDNLPSFEVPRPPITAILPPWSPTLQNQFSDTVACKESFEATSCTTEQNEVQYLIQRTILPKPDTRWKDSQQSVYSNDLPSPLRHRLINAMSPMLSGDTMDEDSVSEWSSRYDPSRAGGSEAANAQCCSILSCFDFGTFEEKLRSICRFDNQTN